MKYFGSAIIGLACSIALTTGASAAVVCNDEGDCWKVKDKHKYPPEVNVEIYDDDWKWPEGGYNERGYLEARNNPLTWIVPH